MTQDHLGGIKLKSNTVEAVYNEEGRAYNTGSGFRYEYVLRDQRSVAPLVNTRLVFTDKNGSGSIAYGLSIFRTGDIEQKLA